MSRPALVLVSAAFAGLVTSQATSGADRQRCPSAADAVLKANRAAAIVADGAASDHYVLCRRGTGRRMNLGGFIGGTQQSLRGEAAAVAGENCFDVVGYERCPRVVVIADLGSMRSRTLGTPSGCADATCGTVRRLLVRSGRRAVYTATGGFGAVRTTRVLAWCAGRRPQVVAESPSIRSLSLRISRGTDTFTWVDGPSVRRGRWLCRR